MWTPAARRPFLGSYRAPCRLAALAVLAGAALSAVAGCRGEPAAGSYAKEVESRLQTMGFQTWFPPEPGVEAGQIWAIDLALNRSLVYARPPAVDPPAARPEPTLTGIRDLALSADEAMTLADALSATDRPPAAGGTAGPDASLLRAALTAAGASTAKVDLGPATVRDLTPAALDRPEVVDRLPRPYRDALAAARSGSPRHVYVAGVAEVAGLTCTWTVDDSASVAAALPRLRADLAGRGDLSVVDRRAVRFTVPPTRVLAIGVRRLVGGAGFGAPATPAAVTGNLDHLATFDAQAGVELRPEGSRLAGLADRAAFVRWLGGFRRQPGVDERVAELSATVRAAPSVAGPGGTPDVVRLSYRDVATLMDVQRTVAEEAVRRGFATVEEVREKAHIGG